MARTQLNSNMCVSCRRNTHTLPPLLAITLPHREWFSCGFRFWMCISLGICADIRCTWVNAERNSERTRQCQCAYSHHNRFYGSFYVDVLQNDAIERRWEFELNITGHNSKTELNYIQLTHITINSNGRRDSNSRYIILIFSEQTNLI